MARDRYAPGTLALVPTVAIGILTVALVALSFDSLTFSMLALGLAFGIAVVAAFGAEKVGTAAIILAFATAPMYKGLAPSRSSTVTATDALLVVGFGLLLPRLLSGRLRLPAPYLAGVLLVFVSSLIGTLTTNVGVLHSVASVMLWIAAMFLLPLVIGLWNPGDRIVTWLALAYVAGQVFDMFYAAGVNGGQRWTGLSTQPNYFAQAGLLSVAMLLFLENRFRGWTRIALLVVAAACCFGVVQSGSRAGTVVLAVVILLFPLFERSQRLVVGVAAAGSVAVIGMLFLLPASGGSNVLSRLLGQGSAVGSDAQRTQGLRDGWHSFIGSPIIGHGIKAQLLYSIHNNYLEVAVVGGVIAFGGYLMVLTTLVRPLFLAPQLAKTKHTSMRRAGLRRLGYPVLAYIGFGATVPSLVDRSVWVLVALAVLVYQQDPADGSDRATDSSIDYEQSLEESRV